MRVCLCLWKMSFAFDLGSSLVSISVILDRMVGALRNRSCIVFARIGLVKGELEVTQIQ